MKCLGCRDKSAHVANQIITAALEGLVKILVKVGMRLLLRVEAGKKTAVVLLFTQHLTVIASFSQVISPALFGAMNVATEARSSKKIQSG